MASGTVAQRLEASAAVWHVGIAGRYVALQAQHPLFPPSQQRLVRTSMRIVAARASLYPHSAVLEHKRPALLHMTLNAGFRPGFYERRPVCSAMWAVAIGALHLALGDPMMPRQRERCPHIGMAPVAEFRLILFQKAAGQPAIFLGQ